MPSFRSGTAWAVIAGVALVYFLAGQLGLQLAFVHPNATVVWPPTGIALAALLVWGYWVWPGIFLGAYLVNIMTAGSVATSIGIAVGNTLEGIVGAYLVTRFAHGRQAFDRASDVFKFAALAGFGSTMVSATIGVTSLAAGGYAHWANYGSIWLTWWLGDASGALLVAPVLILWHTSFRIDWHWTQGTEAALIGLAIALAGSSIFGGLVFADFQPYPLEFLCAPLLVWTAFRFTQREAATASLLMAGFAIVGTLRGYGPFARWSPHESLLLLQAFMGIMAMIALSLVAALTERRQPGKVSHEEARQLQKMAEFGRFTGGIVHDFHNVVYVIRLYSEMLTHRRTLKQEDRKAIEEIAQAATRANSLTAQLLAFGRRRAVQPVLLNLNAVTSNMDSMLRRLLGARVTLHTVLAPSLGQVHADPTQLEQVLLNLVGNARDAMPRGGQLTIETANVELDDAYVRQHPGARAGSYVMLAVQDTGTGMDAATQAHLFEAFFTTKEAGQGTGLGLSIIYGITKQNGGYLAVESAPGQGTTFRVFLPRVCGSVENTRSPSSSGETP